MSCTSGFPTFRLLDSYAGWDQGEDAYDKAENLVGFDDPKGVRLAQRNLDEVNPTELLGYLPPARLARGCGQCDWYLITPAPPAPRLLHRDPCSGEWTSIWDEDCAPDYLIEPVAVAAWRRRIAVSDRGAKTVWVWSGRGSRLSARIELAEPGPLAFTPRGLLLVAAKENGSWRVHRFGPTGEPRGSLPQLPQGKVDRLAVSLDCAVWLILENSGALEIWQLPRGSHEFKRSTIADLSAAFSPTGLTAMSERGFCLEQRDANNLPIVCCFSWYGRPLCEDVPVPTPTRLYERGQLLTKAIDSGISRCRWHRVRLDADIPSGTSLEVSVSTSEDENPTPQGDATSRGAWEGFHAGVPHQRDWQVAPDGSVDFLVQQQPPGRYLFVRVRFTGSGTNTPVVRQVRLEFPRQTSLDLMPPVYRENPDAEDFSERFLSLFDASIADLDAAVERYPALLDPEGVPAEVLPWLGTFVDVSLDSSWTTERRRAILRAVPTLYRKRGTVEGLKLAVELVFGITPAIQEIAAERMWGAIASSKRPQELKVRARLGEVRLFGRSSSRFRLGSSALSRTPLRSFGNPDRDPLSNTAYRFRVLVPPTADRSALWRERLRRLIESQKPAHTIASTRVGGNGFVLGAWSAIGIDTVFGTLPPPVLGKTGNVRLNRMSVLWPGPHGVRAGIVPNRTAVVGVKTVLE
jgi:phage tail-like protein